MLLPWNWRFRLGRAPSLEQMDLGAAEGVNPLMIQFFEWDVIGTPEVSWWCHFQNEIPRLAQLGVTQVWLPPPNKAMEKYGRGYDAYDLWDLGEFDQKEAIETRWGSKAELIRAIAAARQHGIQVLIDAVLNHKIGADRVEQFTAEPVDPSDRRIPIGPEKTIEGWTHFAFPGRRGKYSGMIWSYEHFTGIDWDARERIKGVFKITQARPKGWSQHVSNELGNYDYLLGADIDHLHPAVRSDLLAWATWILNETGGMGFRLDACKHFDYRFLCDFVITARKAPGHSRLFSVAEFWSADVKLLLAFMKQLSAPIALFDVPLHENFHRASIQGRDFDLRRIMRDSLVEVRPRDAVTFVENHDTVVGQSLETPVAKTFKAIAYAIILLRREGYPCVYHGDLYGPDAIPELPVLMKARAKFAWGPCKDVLKKSNDPNVVAFARSGTKTRPGCVVVLSNGTTSYTVNINVGSAHANSTWMDLLQRAPEIRISKSGVGAFLASPGVAVFVKKSNSS